MNKPTKYEILNLLDAFVSQRSGMDWRDYGSRESAMEDYNRILQSGRDARRLIQQAYSSAIEADTLLSGFSAYSGRLKLEKNGNEWRLTIAQVNIFQLSTVPLSVQFWPEPCGNTTEKMATQARP